MEKNALKQQLELYQIWNANLVLSKPLPKKGVETIYWNENSGAHYSPRNMIFFILYDTV